MDKPKAPQVLSEKRWRSGLTLFLLFFEYFNSMSSSFHIVPVAFMYTDKMKAQTDENTNEISLYTQFARGVLWSDSDFL